mgnify:CR=1 FL=1
MTCVHTETTAVLAAFGEAPPEFEHHLNTCQACRQVVNEHLQTLSVVNLARDEVVQTAPAQWNPYAAGFLAAAALLLAVQFGIQEPATITSPAHTPPTITEQALFDTPLDDELASIEMELALFNLEET